MKLLGMCLSFIMMFFAQPTFAADVKDVLMNLKGCFEVSYRFVEDGEHDLEITGLYEKINYEKKGEEFHFQHYGIVDGKSFKHWREEWSTEDGKTWKQVVIGPFEDFRYECGAKFTFNQWRCFSADAAKPRRDKDRDYEFLDRENTIQLTPKGWVHSQNNVKKDLDGVPLSNELGWIEYRRTDDKNCETE